MHRFSELNVCKSTFHYEKLHLVDIPHTLTLNIHKYSPEELLRLSAWNNMQG